MIGLSVVKLLSVTHTFGSAKTVVKLLNPGLNVALTWG